MRAIRRAPLYTHALDLGVWLELHRLGRGNLPIQGEVCAVARELLFRIGAALSFPTRRRAHLRLADEAVLRLRLLVELGAAAREFAPPARRLVESSLLPIGRMLGGWQRQLTGQHERPGVHAALPTIQESDQAPRASCAVAATGTTPTTAGPPTATGTIPTTPTTTRASGSSVSASRPNPRRRVPSRAGPTPAASEGNRPTAPDPAPPPQ